MRHFGTPLSLSDMTSRECNNDGQTKGQEDFDVPLKMERLRQWCEDINRAQSDVVYDFVYVDEESFQQYKPSSFSQLVDGFREYR